MLQRPTQKEIQFLHMNSAELCMNIRGFVPQKEMSSSTFKSLENGISLPSQDHRPLPNVEK